MSRKKFWPDCHWTKNIITLVSMRHILDKVEAHYQKQYPVTLVLKDCFDMAHNLLLPRQLYLSCLGTQPFLKLCNNSLFLLAYFLLCHSYF